MKTIYDTIGKSYSIGRKTDPIIFSNIYQFLSDASSILNIGAGTGSYEPADKELVALEPATTMIQQRAKSTKPVVQAFAEKLPFKDAYFSHAMTVLSMHHWLDRHSAFSEIKRVITRRFVALTWNPDTEGFWLTRDYFPELHQYDRAVFPPLNELAAAFPGIKFYPLAIPANCEDGFTAAYWSRPQAYLDKQVRTSMSSFRKIKHLDSGLNKLKTDLSSGRWLQNNEGIRHLKQLDLGYTLAVWDT